MKLKKGAPRLIWGSRQGSCCMSTILPFSAFSISGSDFFKFFFVGAYPRARARDFSSQVYELTSYFEMRWL